MEHDVLPRQLGMLEAILEKSKTGWIAGTEGPSIADFVLQPRLKWLDDGVALEQVSGLMKRYPRLTAMMEALLSLPAIQKYYQEHKLN